MKLENLTASLVLILVLIAVGGVLFILFRSNRNFNAGEKSCFVDEDCVPAECCHAKDVVNKIYVPDCSNIACTQVCLKDTLDCGYGKPACTNNRCVIVWTK